MWGSSLLAVAAYAHLAFGLFCLSLCIFSLFSMTMRMVLKLSLIWDDSWKDEGIDFGLFFLFFFSGGGGGVDMK